MRKKHILLFIIAVLLGILCATWHIIGANQTTETLMAASLFMSLIALINTTYYTVETALELRSYNRKKMFSDYCARFSNDSDLKKVAEWLLFISKKDTHSNYIKRHKMSKKGQSETYMEPTPFEIERFWSFLIELNIQIKNKQIEKEDANHIFSRYAQLISIVLETHDKNNKWDRTVIAELLPEEIS